jgi:endoglucanase
MRSAPAFVWRFAATVVTVLAVVAAVCSATAASTAAPSSPRLSARAGWAGYVNPLVGHRWGVYKGGSDGLWPAYQHASGRTKKLLGRMALRPHVRWYTNFIPPSEIAEKVRDDIAQEQQGNRNVLVWMATFRLWPHHESAKREPLSAVAQDRYKRWVNHAARGIGSSRVALVLEPDLPVTTKGWRPAVRLALVRYAAQRFSSLPHTTVYLDAGSADWVSVRDDAAMLKAAGIGYVHGFALGSTHHTSTGREIRYGRQLAIALAKAGNRNKHFIIDTSDNGHGYTWGQFWAAHPHGDYNDPPACSTMRQRNCVSLGIPPTTNVTNPNWHLPPRLHGALQHRCDAFVWIARPWLADNGKRFSMHKALNASRTWPFAQ